MESRAALGAAAALALTVTGGVSALFLAVGQASGAESSTTTADTAVTVEYVDEFGNPVAPPTAEAGATAPEVILLNPDGTPVAQPAAAEGATAVYGMEGEAEEYEEEAEDYDDEAEAYEDEEEYDEGEDEEHDEDGDEYVAGGHVEDEDHETHEDHEDD
jgi:hypothetical protein